MTKFTNFSNQAPLVIGLSLTLISFTVLPSVNSPLLSNDVIEFKNSIYRTYGQGNEQLVLKSKKGNINLLNKSIYLVEFNKTQQVFENPNQKETKDYISGKFG